MRTIAHVEPISNPQRAPPQSDEKPPTHIYSTRVIPELSVVVPAFNEEGSLRALHARLTPVLESCAASHEIILVDDGSRDRTLDVMRELADSDPRVRYVSFSRNFGHEVATTAGLDHAIGRAVVLIDADLQDPPELIPTMVERWRAGADVVYAQRRIRAGESPFKKATSWLFYRVIDRLSDVRIPRDVGDFRLMSARVVDAVRKFEENPRFMRGLVSWVGFKQEAVPYDRDARHAGETKYQIRHLFRLAAEAIAAFSLKPLKLTVYLGLAAILISVALTLMIIVQKLFLGAPTSGQHLAGTMPQGYALLMCSIFFLGGVQLLMLGILAHYLGHVFRMVQRRPLYLVAEARGVDGISRGGSTPPRERVLVEPKVAITTPRDAH